MAQIYRCDLCGSYEGKPGLAVSIGNTSRQVSIGNTSRQFVDYPPLAARGWGGFAPVEYSDLCLTCAQAVVKMLEARKADRK